MNRKENNILILLLLCAGLLVVMLYSPIGSPENYISSNSYGQNQGVVFSGKILNAPKGKTFANNSSVFSSVSIPNTTSLPNSSFATPSVGLNNNLPTPATVSSFATKRTANYAVVNTSESSVSSNTTYTVQNAASFSSEIKNNSGGGSGGGSGATFSGRTSRNKSNVQTGFTALNVDLTIFNDLNTSQGGGYTPGSGATDPGEDPMSQPTSDPGGNPNGEPIPVSDGFWLLLLMAIGYAYMKFSQKKKHLVKI